MLQRSITGWVPALAVFGLSALSVACAHSTDELTRPEDERDSSAGSGGGGAGTDNPIAIDSGPSSDVIDTTVSIRPMNPVIDVTVVNGIVTSMTTADGGNGPITFTATYGSTQDKPHWSIDRGDLGTFDTSTGVFTPNGARGGTAEITATFGQSNTTTTVAVSIHASQNGRATLPDGGPDAAYTCVPGLGGCGGVGGEGLGGPVTEDQRTALLAATAVKPSSTTFGWLYPFDKTVWPRGLLAPLLQWQTTASPVAVYIHLKEADFEFQGLYAANNPNGATFVRQPIEQGAWDLALGSNTGEYLTAQITVIDAAGKVYGPIAQDWIVASGRLHGTVYYGSYNTSLAASSGTSGAGVLAIRPGESEPELAIPQSKDQCYTCHTVSPDGSTLFVEHGYKDTSGNNNYNTGYSYDLRTKTLIQRYPGETPAPDGSVNKRKFVWTASWLDGSFGVRSATDSLGFPMGLPASFGYPDEMPTKMGVYRRDNGSAVLATGINGIEYVVTPSFSPDGKKLVFNYWAGTLSPGAGGGGTLDSMDVTCNSPRDDAGTGTIDAGVYTTGPDAEVSSGGAPPACGSVSFTNLRRIYDAGETRSEDTGGYVGWPSWLPDSSGVIFQYNMHYYGWTTPLLTWGVNKAELWLVTVPANPDDVATSVNLRNLNGDSYLNFEPTVTPIASGGYYWVLFTSRRLYGNVADGNPYDAGNGTYPIRKKLWVAAIDQHGPAGQDPSHPAFYLPGQELNAGNFRGSWVVDPCRNDGESCDAGDQCCNGFCRAASGSDTGLVCGHKPPDGCANEFERCTTSSECCGYLPGGDGFVCVNDHCAQPPAQPPIK